MPFLQTQPQERQQVRRQQPPASAAPDALQSVVQLVCYVLLIYCNTLGRVFRALLWCSWAVGAHACLRRSPTEYLEALKSPEISSGRVEPLSGHPSVPGIAFTEVRFRSHVQSRTKSSVLGSFLPKNGCCQAEVREVASWYWNHLTAASAKWKLVMAVLAFGRTQALLSEASDGPSK